ncbi:scp family extracellular subfamily protein [Cystoisospora suis]|uniref:Scp family extracellular subfamily protein n=1 Tax=Cystoisospora suis TaxID=483139 RepID=A0A2C6KP36_9APIC|nr:scp family extracellular subfamily protein [Cystoisospora suis]
MARKRFLLGVLGLSVGAAMLFQGAKAGGEYQDITSDCLKWHNAYRQDGLGSNAVPAMKADSNAKKVMKVVAEKLMKSNCASVQHSTEAKDAKLGENIFDSTRAATSCQEPVSLWYKEYQNFGGTYPGTHWSSSHFGMVGHFTQVMWSSSVGLGCFMIKGCSQNSNPVFCLYSPAGNYVGMAPFSEATWKAIVSRGDKTPTPGSAGFGLSSSFVGSTVLLSISAAFFQFAF